MEITGSGLSPLLMHSNEFLNRIRFSNSWNIAWIRIPKLKVFVKNQSIYCISISYVINIFFFNRNFVLFILILIRSYTDKKITLVGFIKFCEKKMFDSLWYVFLVWQILSMKSPSFTRPVSEREWLKNSAKIWEQVKNSPTMLEYCRTLQQSGMFRRWNLIKGRKIQDNLCNCVPRFILFFIQNYQICVWNSLCQRC